jgi:hypothetical protein
MEVWTATIFVQKNMFRKGVDSFLLSDCQGFGQGTFATGSIAKKCSSR